jgi:GAF domain-containing protein
LNTDSDIAGMLHAIVQRFESLPEARADQLLEVTSAARDNLHGVDFASISILQADGSLITAAATDPLIDEADHWQYQYQEGPCYAAVTAADVLVSPDVGADDRWPNYGPRARGLGLRAQTAVPLFKHEGSHGALNLYSSTPDAFVDPDHLVDIFARQASLALGHASEVHGLRKAVYTRKVIGEAIGIVMERYHISEDRAFEYLIRVSQTGNIKLRDVAEELVQQGNTS